MNAPSTEPADDDLPERGGTVLLAWLRLLRLPNVFSAWADVLLGWFAGTALGLGIPLPWLLAAAEPAAVAADKVDDSPLLRLVLLLAASSCLYLGGMVLNDVYDVEEDRRDRPFRPLPSGKVATSTARRVGFGLLAAGLLSAASAALVGPTIAPLLVAVPLALLVWGYDSYLKSTVMGPVAMGGCRALNVLLGMNAPLEAWRPGFFVVAGVMGLYIVGVTTFARTEAAPKGRGSLLLGAALIAGAFGLMLWLPTRLQDWGWPKPRVDLRWTLLVCILWMMILTRLLPAILKPTAADIQAGVKKCLQSYLLIVTAMVFLFRTPAEAAVVFALIVPQMILARWVYST